jgi:hypothetical protein
VKPRLTAKKKGAPVLASIAESKSIAQNKNTFHTPVKTPQAWLLVEDISAIPLALRLHYQHHQLCRPPRPLQALSSTDPTPAFSPFVLRALLH